MHLLIVHGDAEIGEPLVQMVKDYTGHDCDLLGSEAAAINWARRNRQCSLLLTQLEAEGIDGLALGASLSEVFPSLQVLFFPSYPASDQRLELAEKKVFPEPIDGDALLDAINRAQDAAAGAPDLFQVIDILQMCCLSRRSGALQMVKEEKSGLVFLRSGKIVHAETTARRGKDALFEIVSWKHVEFAYDRSVRGPVETIAEPWDEILIEAAAKHKEQKTTGSRRQSA